jgi:hypothetical protein
VSPCAWSPSIANSTLILESESSGRKSVKLGQIKTQQVAAHDDMAPDLQN